MKTLEKKNVSQFIKKKKFFFPKLSKWNIFDIAIILVECNAFLCILAHLMV